MATRTIIAAGGNWSANGTWVEGVAPTSADTIVATASSGPLNINSATLCFAGNCDFTNYTSTLSGTGNVQLYGNLTLATGMTITTTGFISINSGGTWTSNGKIWTGIIAPVLPSTVTLADNWVVNGTLLHTTGGGLTTFNGNTISIGGNVTLPAGRTLLGTTTLILNTSTTQQLSVSGLIQNNLLFNAAGTITITGLVYNTGTITYSSGTMNVTGALTITNSTTLNTSGMTWLNVAYATTSGLISTHNSNLNVSTTLSLPVNMTFAGTAGFTTANVSAIVAARTINFNTGSTYTITSGITATGTLASPIVFKSSTAGQKAIITLAQGSSQDIDFLNATDIDSSGGLTFWSFQGVLSNTINWNPMISQPITANVF